MYSARIVGSCCDSGRGDAAVKAGDSHGLLSLSVAVRQQVTPVSGNAALTLAQYGGSHG